MRRLALALTFALGGCATTPTDGDGGARDLGGGGDLRPTCMPGCGGLTPICNASHHCTGCAVDGDCPIGQVCHVVSDTQASCVPGCSGDASCGGGKCCGGRCSDVTSDAENCGACGMSCSSPHAQVACAGAKCVTAGCDPGWGDCGNGGCGTNLAVDPSNCTACGMACALPHAVQACANGCYLAACQFGWDDCDVNADTGCETAVLLDPANCGRCGRSCAALPNATASCVNGNCVLGACLNGYFDCNGDPNDGCEASLLSDPKNCGQCGMVCPMNMASCGNGVCGTCNGAVLVLGEGAAADMQLATLLKQNGMTPTVVTWTGYQGNPAAATFGSVVVLCGVNYSNDMPAAGQQSLVAATAAGTGIVFYEWGGFELFSNRWTQLKSIEAMQYTTGTTSSSGPVYTNTVNHPVWTGVPSPFTFVNTSVGLGVPQLINGATGIATYSCGSCTAGTTAVAVRDTGIYRVVNDSSAPNYTGDSSMWGNDPNRMKLVVNYLRWAAHCM